MNVKIQTFTPELAKKILKVQEDRIAKGDLRQRSLDDRTVLKYAHDMRSGHWLVNNQGIGFNAKGDLIDGRHRLWAVVKCGKPVKMLAIYGLTDHQNNTITVKAIDTIDCGRQRALAQQLRIDGLLNSALMAAAVRAVSIVAIGHPNRKLSTSMAKGILSIYQHDFQKVFTLLHSAARISRGFFLGPVAMWHSAHPIKAAQFCTDYVDLISLSSGSPIIALKKYMETHSSRQTDASVKAVCCAIQHYSNDNKVQLIKPSDEALQWLLKSQGEKAKQIISIVGTDK